MTAQIVQIWRHPIKSHGREALTRIAVMAHAALPWDRTWAVAHEAARLEGDGWHPCANFSRVSKAPALMAITAKFDEASEIITLSHPDRPMLVAHPETDCEALLDWVKPLMPVNRAASSRVVRLSNRGWTDTDFPSISIGNLASLRALEGRLGRPLTEHRWRANLWIDGLAPWEERDWIGKTIKIGGLTMAVRENVIRCLATTTNPLTGQRDTDTLALLNETVAAPEFCLYAEALTSGEIAIGDEVKVS